MSKPKIAIVHDWLTAYGGAERVLERLIRLFPNADLFCLIDSGTCLSAGQPGEPKRTTQSLLRYVPGIHRNYGLFANLMPQAIERLKVKDYDLIISSSWAFAHGIVKGPHSKQLVYCHTPMRWAWDLEQEYLERSGLSGLPGKIARWQLGRLRNWDYRRAQDSDLILANSRFIEDRIRRCWNRESHVVYPPVNLGQPTGGATPGDYYLVASRLVPFKRVDLWIDAFLYLPDRQLIVAGSGPQESALRARAPANVKFLGRVSDQTLQALMAGAKGFLQASKEDFGIAVIEAQGCGTPVLAFGEGGALEGIWGPEHARPTGIFFYTLEPEAAAKAVLEFERHSFAPQDCIASAQRFSPQAFDSNFMHHVQSLGF